MEDTPDSAISTSQTFTTGIDRAYDAIADPSRHSITMPFLIENSELPELPLKPGDTYKFIYQMAGVTLHGTVTVRTAERPTCYEQEISGDITSKWYFSLTPQGESTDVTLDITYRAPAKLSEIDKEGLRAANQKQAELYLRGVKTLAEM
jgi:hypothetical protein